MLPNVYDVAASIAEKMLGISLVAIGEATLKSAIEVRTRDLGYTHSEYSEMLRLDHEEQTTFCQLLLISESWFCREPDPVIEALSVLRLENKNISVLSAPCARGEECLSAIHMALIAGFRLDQIEVDGYDASYEAIQIAQSYSYPAFSFRSSDSNFEANYFDSKKKLKPLYRERLSYGVANLLSSSWIPRLVSYDLILCRNLLIYLSTASQKNLLDRLSRLLSNNGLIVVAAAEAPILTSLGFANLTDSPLIFSKQREIVKTNKKPKKILKTSKPIQSTTKVERKIKKTNNQKFDTKLDLAVLKSIKHLADQGNFNSAFEKALDLLDVYPSEGEIYFLLGVICSSCGQIHEACNWIERALQFSPDHEDAKLYLDILSDARK